MIFYSSMEVVEKAFYKSRERLRFFHRDHCGLDHTRFRHPDIEPDEIFYVVRMGVSRRYNGFLIIHKDLIGEVMLDMSSPWVTVEP